MSEKYICCLCGKECNDWGNNPWPLVSDEDARCCDECNASKVIIARLVRIKQQVNDSGV